MNHVPRHIAIVMDGNGRWAKKRSLPRIAGHRAGAKSVRNIVEVCGEIGVEVLTLFAFSKENWKRPRTEVKALMSLFVQTLQKESKKLHKNDVKLRIIGDLSGLEKRVQAGVEFAEELTAGNSGLRLNIAVNYSGRWDIANTAQKIAFKTAAGELSPEQVDEALFGSMVCLADLPDPDLFIRTSGEERISNFMLWQFAYTELYFTDVLWPDFRRDALEEAIRDYQKRERRFGDVNARNNNNVSR